MCESLGAVPPCHDTGHGDSVGTQGSMLNRGAPAVLEVAGQTMFLIDPAVVAGAKG